MSNFGGTGRRYGDQMGRLELEGDLCLQRAVDASIITDRASGDATVVIQLGQGLNMGIRDAAAAQVLQSHTGGVNIGDLPVLKRYERWRKQKT